MIIRAYPALYLGGTPSQETGNSPPSCQLLKNCLSIYFTNTTMLWVPLKTVTNFVMSSVLQTIRTSHVQPFFMYSIQTVVHLGFEL